MIRLWPQPSTAVELRNLYLDERLWQQATRERPFVYTNYVSSLDGRIALRSAEENAYTVPASIANPRDWRLFQELAAQADVLVTSGRHLRDRAAGIAQEIIAVYEQPDFADLRAWREAQGLSVYPALAVVSKSLDFVLPPEFRERVKRVVFFTGTLAPAARIEALRKEGFRVVEDQAANVSATTLITTLSALGHRTIYSVTGPEILHLLLSANVLDRLYLTVVHRLLGGVAYRTLVEGEILARPAGFQLRTLYFDPHAPAAGVGQSFYSFVPSKR